MKEKQSKKIFTRMLMNNWGGISHKVMEFHEYVNLFSGKSGSGKSTLLKCMSGLLQPSQGKVEIQGLDPYQTSPNKLAKLRRESLAFIFQSYNLVPALPIIENIALPLRLSGKKVNNQEILELLEKLQFKADSKVFPSTLSGGEQNFTALAGVLAMQPRVLLLDEPTNGLDVKNIAKLTALLRELQLPMLIASHDLRFSETLADSCLSLATDNDG